VNTVRAFVDGVQSVVAVELFDVELPGVAIAAVDLDREVVGSPAPLCRPALGDGGKNLQKKPSAVAVRARADAGFVDQPCAVQSEGQSALDIGLLRQQHALDVGMLDRRDL
jgi:hypothetical protein